MPLTPFHVGPHACIGLALHRYVDIPIFVGINVAIDVEPLLVMVYHLDHPLHGTLHTLLVGGVVGILFATLAYPFRRWIGKAMGFLRLPYTPTYLKMVVAGVTGAWLHILLDSLLYLDIQPFYPAQANPLYGRLSPRTVYGLCWISFAPALLLYMHLAFVRGAGKEERPPSPKDP